MTRKFSLAFCLMLAGCAVSPHVQRARLALPLAQSMNVEVRLTQHQISVSHMNSTAGAAAGVQMAGSPAVAAGGFAAGAGAGLIGALVDVAINAHRSNVAEEAEKPLREHMGSTDVDALVYRSIDGLEKKLFAENISVEHIDRAEADDEKQGRLNAGTSVLVLVPSYSVSYDGKTFTYVLAAKLVDRTQGANGKIDSSTRYQQVFQYVVAENDIPDGVHLNQLSSDQWAAIFTQASTETVAMLNYDVNAQPSDAQPKMDYGRFVVLLDQDKGSRSWVRTNFSLLSVPSSSLKAQGRS